MTTTNPASPPGVTLLPFNGKIPRIHSSAFIAPGCRIIGDVEIGPDASVWYNCVVRGDANRIVIGARTNIQDGSVLHNTSPTSTPPLGYALHIGADVTIGHKAILHGCTIGDRVLIGMGAIVMDGAVVQDDVIVGGGSVVSPGKVLESGGLYVGSPAKRVRDLKPQEYEFLKYSAAHYVKLKNLHMSDSKVIG